MQKTLPTHYLVMKGTNKSLIHPYVKDKKFSLKSFAQWVAKSHSRISAGCGDEQASDDLKLSK